MTVTSDDPFNLARFGTAQADVYPQVLRELAEGRKRTHWIWFIFPQVSGLGRSSTATYFAIRSAAEARAYLADDLLASRLVECTRLMVETPGNDATAILGSPDDLKFRSSMTLFAAVSDEPLFVRALEKFFAGEGDARTRAFLRA